MNEHVTAAHMTDQSHVTSSGTYVAPHAATNPNRTQRDNYTATGNVPPYTGAVGTRNPIERGEIISLSLFADFQRKELCNLTAISTRLVSSSFSRGDNEQGQYAAKNVRNCLEQLVKHENIQRRAPTPLKIENAARTLCTAVLQSRSMQVDFCAHIFHDAKAELALFK